MTKREVIKAYIRELAAMPDPSEQQGAMVLFFGSLTQEEQAEIPDIALELVREAVATIAASLRSDSDNANP